MVLKSKPNHYCRLKHTGRKHCSADRKQAQEEMLDLYSRSGLKLKDWWFQCIYFLMFLISSYNESEYVCVCVVPQHTVTGNKIKIHSVLHYHGSTKETQFTVWTSPDCFIKNDATANGHVDASVRIQLLSHVRLFNQNHTPWAPLTARRHLPGAQQQHKLSVWEEGSQGGLLDHGRQNLDRGRNYLCFRFFAVALLLTGERVLLASFERLAVDVCGLMRLRSREHVNWKTDVQIGKGCWPLKAEE